MFWKSCNLFTRFWFCYSLPPWASSRSFLRLWMSSIRLYNSFSWFSFVSVSFLFWIFSSLIFCSRFLVPSSRLNCKFIFSFSNFWSSSSFESRFSLSLSNCAIYLSSKSCEMATWSFSCLICSAMLASSESFCFIWVSDLILAAFASSLCLSLSASAASSWSTSSIFYEIRSWASSSKTWPSAVSCSAPAVYSFFSARSCLQASISSWSA